MTDSLSLTAPVLFLISATSTIFATLTACATFKREQNLVKLQHELKELKNLLGIQIHEPIKLRFQDLRKKVRNTASDVKRYLNLGWIGVCEILYEQNLGVDSVMAMWRRFHTFLLRLQHLFLKSERILTLWEKILRLVLFVLSFSEFPDKRRPLCTTMPWTIWPALVVLWGVCWMFYNGFGWNWEDQAELPMAESLTMLFEDNEYSDLSQVFSLDSRDISNIPARITPGFDLPNLEPQLQLGVPEVSNTATYLDPVSTSLAVNTFGSISPSVTYHSNANRIVAAPSPSTCLAADMVESTIEDQRPAATDSRALIPFSASLIYAHPRDYQVGSSGSSRHGQTEKYFCPHRDCIRSQQGSGFKRKDKLDQHLRGPHRQTSVPRLRATPASADTNNITDGVVQSKKRKRGDAEEMDMLNVDQLEKELAEERKLRKLAEQHSRRLQEQLDDSQRRMEKYERLDKILTLWEEHKVRKRTKE